MSGSPLVSQYFSRWWNWGPERLINLLKVTEESSPRAVLSTVLLYCLQQQRGVKPVQQESRVRKWKRGCRWLTVSHPGVPVACFTSGSSRCGSEPTGDNIFRCHLPQERSWQKQRTSQNGLALERSPTELATHLCCICLLQREIKLLVFR